MTSQSTVSTKYQLVLPKNIRQKFKVLPSDKVYIQYVDEETLIVKKNLISLKNLKGSFQFSKNYLKSERAAW